MKIREKLIEGFLLLSALITVLTTSGIIFVLLVETISFFQEVSIIDFLTDTEWTPSYSQKHFGILPLLSGTLLVTAIAICFSLPIGLSIAIYLTDYVSTKTADRVRPILDLLASIPTVVYGYFALTTVTPFLQFFFPSIAGYNALSAGLVVGMMIIPFISSLSQDALRAVPNSLREAAYGLGSTRFQTAFNVTVPAAGSGIVVSVILAISRAVGETMIVAMAAGQQPRLTIDPTVPIETITSYIVQVSLGDAPHGSLAYKTIFATGITLFTFTFILNNISFWIKNRFTEKYE